MMDRAPRWAVPTLVLVVVIAGSIAVAGPVPAQDVDWPDERPDARTVTLEDGTATVEGRVSGGDADWLRVPVDRGDVLNVTQDVVNNDLAGVRLHFRNYNRTGELVDRERSLRQRDDAPIGTNVTAVADGYVHVRVTSGDSTVKPWRIHLERHPDADAWPTPVLVEPGEYAGRVNSPDDRDELGVSGDGRDVVRATLTKRVGSDVHIDWIQFPGGAIGGMGNRSGKTIVRRVLVERGAGSGNVSVAVGADRDAGAPRWSLVLDRFVDADLWPSPPREAYPGTAVTGAVDAPEDEDPVLVPMLDGDTLELTLRATGGAVKLTVFRPNAQRVDRREAPAGGTVSIRVNASEAGFARLSITSRAVEANAVDWELVIAGSRSESFWLERRGEPAGPNATLPPLGERSIAPAAGGLPEIPDSISVPLPDWRTIAVLVVGVVLGLLLGGISRRYRRRE